MRELRVGTVPDIKFDLLPVAGIIPDALAVSADRDDPAQSFDLAHSPLDSGTELSLPQKSDPLLSLPPVHLSRYEKAQDVCEHKRRRNGRIRQFWNRRRDQYQQPEFADS